MGCLIVAIYCLLFSSWLVFYLLIINMNVFCIFILLFICKSNCYTLLASGYYNFPQEYICTPNCVFDFFSWNVGINEQITYCVSGSAFSSINGIRAIYLPYISNGVGTIGFFYYNIANQHLTLPRICTTYKFNNAELVTFSYQLENVNVDSGDGVYWEIFWQ